MPASSIATTVSVVPSLASPVTWRGQILRRKQTRHRRSRMGVACGSVVLTFHSLIRA
jgi:hypothetical protein